MSQRHVIVITAGLVVVAAMPARSPREADKKQTDLVGNRLRGRITYDGTPPPRADLRPQMENVAAKDYFLQGDTRDRTWLIGRDNGVKNVVVWLRSAQGGPLPVPEGLRRWNEEPVTIDQVFGHCEPRVVALYPSYWNAKAKRQEPTGQLFKVVNSAPINHCVHWKGNELFNPGMNTLVAPGKELQLHVKPNADSKSGEDLVRFGCDVYKWMVAYAWVFDHPFAAVTKEDGTFEIKGIPADVDVEIAYWHESMGRSPKVVRKTLKAGDTDFSVKIKE